MLKKVQSENQPNLLLTQASAKTKVNEEERKGVWVSVLGSDFLLCFVFCFLVFLIYFCAVLGEALAYV